MALALVARGDRPSIGQRGPAMLAVIVRERFHMITAIAIAQKTLEFGLVGLGGEGVGKRLALVQRALAGIGQLADLIEAEVRLEHARAIPDGQVILVRGDRVKPLEDCAVAGLG